MKYSEVTFQLPSDETFISDILSEELGEIGFESFSSEEKLLIGYIPQNLFNTEKIHSLLENFEYCSNIQFQVKEIEDKNWNEEWEKHYFNPIIIDNECVIHSTFHKDIPTAKYDILIDPKMAFGTGHHETTSLILQTLLETEIKGKTVLDMGCGTAVLAILAAKKGASSVLAIDIDEWAYKNAIENISLNNETNIDIKLGGAELLTSEKFDIILANINRNILLKDINSYAKCMKSGSELLLSGFYESDIPVIDEETKKYDLCRMSYQTKNNWVAVKYLKK